jgi:hypothetical protein
MVSRLRREVKMKMRNFIVAAVLIPIALVSTPVWGANRDFKLNNFTGYRITGFFFKTEDSDVWVPMHGEQIPTRGSSIVTFNQNGPCELQFRVDTTGGEGDFLRPFDFRKLNYIDVFYDNVTGFFYCSSGFRRTLLSEI